ncbi:MAG: hypothetical protein AABX05_05990, partial [Nanoarchaeota archaeon]
MTLETITGNLRDAYKQLQPGTMLHADELMNERRTNLELRDQHFNTADGAVYFLDGYNKTPTLALTREARNPVLQNIDPAFEQLVNNHNYLVSEAELKLVKKAVDTLLVKLAVLRLAGGNSEYLSLRIGTTPSEYNELNKPERSFAERVYGQGDDFIKNMALLKGEGISET